MKELRRAEITEVTDLPIDLRAPRVNSERWNLKKALLYFSLPFIAGAVGAFIGFEVSSLLHLNQSATTAIIGLGGCTGALLGFIPASRKLLNS